MTRYNDELRNISSGFSLFAKTKTIPREEIQFHLEILTCYSSIYTTDHLKCIASNQKGRIHQNIKD